VGWFGYMSVRYWANQHGAGVIFTEKHADLLERVAHSMKLTPQKAFNRVLKIVLDKEDKKVKKAKRKR